MTNRIRAAIILSMVCLGPVGCGDHESLSAPSAVSPPSVQQPITQPTGVQPFITTLAPRVGSTRGGAWVTIIGINFEPGAKVKFGDSEVTAFVHDSATIATFPNAHAAGTVDVVVANPGGLEHRLTGGYSFAPPESFDFNGNWVAHAGPDYEMPMQFTIRDNVLVSVSCDGSLPVTFTSPPSVGNGEFSFVGDGLAISGTMVSPVNAVGTINLPECPLARWWADKSVGSAGSQRLPPR